MTEPQQPTQSRPEAQQPQWSPPPQQPAGWGAGGPAPAERPMGVTLGAIFLIVMGSLVALGGACSLLGAGLIGSAGAGAQDPTGMFGVAASIFGIVGVIILVLGVLQIVAGAGALSGKNWARWTGVITAIVLAVPLGLLGLAALGTDMGTAAFLIVVAALYVLSAYALIVANAYFASRR